MLFLHFTDGENQNFKMLSNWPKHTKPRSRGIRIQPQVCLNQGLHHQTHTKEIPRKRISRLLIFEAIDHFNSMGVTLFPTIKSYDVLLRTHYFSLLYMTIVILLINYQDIIVLDPKRTRSRVNIFWTRVAENINSQSCPSQLPKFPLQIFVLHQAVLQASAGVLIAFHSYL